MPSSDPGKLGNVDIAIYRCKKGTWLEDWERNKHRICWTQPAEERVFGFSAQVTEIERVKEARAVSTDMDLEFITIAGRTIQKGTRKETREKAGAGNRRELSQDEPHLIAWWGSLAEDWWGSAVLRFHSLMCTELLFLLPSFIIPVYMDPKTILGELVGSWCYWSSYPKITRLWSFFSPLNLTQSSLYSKARIESLIVGLSQSFPTNQCQPEP